MANKKIKLCFFYPHDAVISGGLYYFYALANNIKSDKFQTFIINNKNSKYTKIFKSQHKDCQFTFQSYENGLNFSKNDEILIITQMHFLILALEYFKKYKNARILLLNIHPESHNYLFGNLAIKDKLEINKILNIFDKNNSIAFMDKSLIKVLDDFSDIRFKESYIPAFVEKVSPKYQNVNIINPNEINIGCVCRLDIDKIQTVLNLINNISKIKTEKKINLHLIGDGHFAHYINDGKYKNKVNIIKLSYIYGEQLQEYAKNNIDIAVNFGIAALDMASQKLPVVIPVYEQIKHQIDMYSFLCDMPDYILGCNKNLYDKLNIKAYSLEDVIKIVYKKHKKQLIGEQCYDHVIKYHLIENSINAILQYSKETSLTVEKCLKIKSVNSAVNNFHKAKKQGFNWNLYCQNNKKANLNELKFKIAWYLILICLYEFWNIKIDIEKILSKLNKKLAIINNLRRSI